MDDDRKIRLLDFPSGRLEWLISPYANQPDKFGSADSGFPCLPQWNPDGSRFVCIGDGVHAIFNGLNGAYLFKLQDESGLDAHSQWTRDGRYIFNVDIGDGGNTFEIQVWNAKTGKTAVLPPKTGFPFSVSPDSMRISYVDVVTNEVVIADLKTDEILARFTVDYDPDDPQPAWSADSSALAVLDRGSVVRVFSDKLESF